MFWYAWYSAGSSQMIPWPVFSALKSTVVQYFSNHSTWNFTVKKHDCLFSCLQNYCYSTFYCLQYFFMFTVIFNVYSIFSCLQYFFMFTVFFHVYSIFSCLQYFFMFAVFFAYVNTICQTFHSNRLLCYSLLDKDSVLDNFTPLVTKQFSQTFHSNRLLCYRLL